MSVLIPKVSGRAAALIAVFTILVVLVGCLPVPLGDPEKSKVDDRFTGLWLQNGTEADKGELSAVVPFDGRTFLVTDIKFARDAQGHPTPGGDQMTLKMWLTTIAGETFVTLEPKDPASLANKDHESYFIVLHLARTGDTLTVRPVDEKIVKDADVKTPADLEALITKNLKNPNLYGNEVTYTLLGPDRADEAKSILTAAGHGG